MYLDLQDPDSIVSWWREFPQRHWAYLEALDQLTPQFRAAIQQARQRIRQDPRFAALPQTHSATVADPTRAVDDDNDALDFAAPYGQRDAAAPAVTMH